MFIQISFKNNKCELSAIDGFIYSIFHNNNTFHSVLFEQGVKFCFNTSYQNPEIIKDPTNYIEIV